MGVQVHPVTYDIYRVLLSLEGPKWVYANPAANGRKLHIGYPIAQRE